MQRSLKSIISPFDVFYSKNGTFALGLHGCEHERRAVDRSGIRRVLPAVQHDLGVGRYDIPAGAGAQQRVGTLFGFIERQRVERAAENVCLQASENTLPIVSRMRRSAASS